MKLHYYRDPRGNFGDDLNPWLWPKLLPGVLDDNDSELLVGIGTLLNHRLPVGQVKHVFGSGVGYGSLPAHDGRLRFHALRGYLSADRLGVDPDTVITDAAVLLRLVEVPAPTGPRIPVGLMLTGRALNDFDWQRACDDAGIALISCHWPVERVIAEIRRCDLLLSEAMHGAIVADLYRVPWVAVTCTDIVHSLKWRDWLSSLRLPYEPVRITPLFDAARALATRARAASAVKRHLRSLGIWNAGWSDPAPASSSAADVRRAVDELRRARKARPLLSDARLLDSHIARYAERLEGLAGAAARLRSGRAVSTETIAAG